MAEPLNATWHTLQHRDRAVLVPATIAMSVIVLAIVGAFIALNWGAFLSLRDFFSTAFTSELSEQAALEMIGRMFGLVGLALLFMFPLYLAVAAYEAGCLRWIIRGEAPGIFGLTLNVDTWRVYSVYWCWVLLNFVVSTAASVVSFPIMMFTIAQAPPPTNDDPMQMMLWQLNAQGPVMLIQYAALAFFSVRFAPAAAASIVRKRFAFIDAWKVTEGRFWELLGSFALLWLIAAVGYVLAAAIGFAVGKDTIWPALMAFIQEPGPTTFENYFSSLFTPRMMVGMAVGYSLMFVSLIVFYLLSFGLNARAAMVALVEGKIPAPAV